MSSRWSNTRVGRNLDKSKISLHAQIVKCYLLIGPLLKTKTRMQENCAKSATADTQ